MSLPESILDKQQLPFVEDFLLPLYRTQLPGLEVWSLLPDDFPEAGVLVRKDLGNGTNVGDPRGFVENVYVQIDCFATNPDGDVAAAQLAEAIRVVTRDAWLNQTVINNTWISSFRMPAEPSRKADFADSAGPVQYADLPQGFWRYQLRFYLSLRHKVQG